MSSHFFFFFQRIWMLVFVFLLVQVYPAVTWDVIEVPNQPDFELIKRGLS